MNGTIKEKATEALNGDMMRRLRFLSILDDLLSKGFTALILALLVVTIVLVAVAGFAYMALAPDEAMAPPEALWTAFSFATNPELPAYVDAAQTIPYALVTLFVVIAGLLVTSALVGIIATALQSYYEGLQRGYSPVVAEGHIAIVGFNDSVQILIEEFCESHDRDNPVQIVLMDDKLSREDMEQRIANMTGLSVQRLAKERGCKVLCRSGDLRDVDDLRRCAVDRAKSIIINDYDDSLILKTLLAVSSLLRADEVDEGIKHGLQPTIVCTFREDQFARAARHVGHEKSLRVLSVSDTLSNLVAKTCYQPGLSSVLSELYSYEGAEFYLVPGEPFVGEAFDDLTCRFEEAVPVGICRPDVTLDCGSEVILNVPSRPEDDCADVMTVRPNDEVVVLARTAAAATRLSHADAACPVDDLRLWHAKPDAERESKSILVLGYDETFDKTILNLASYYDEHAVEGAECSIKLLYRVKREPRVEKARQRFLSRENEKGLPVRQLSVSHGTSSKGESIPDIAIGSSVVSFQCSGTDVFDLPVLEQVFLAGERYDHVIVLSDLRMDREEADTEMLLTLLYLRAITENARKGLYGKGAIAPFRITSEIQNMENVNLAYNEDVSDYIISWKFIASLQVQIAENRHMYKILRDLLRPKGSEIQLEVVTRYVGRDALGADKPIDFDLLAQHLRQSRDVLGKRVLLGYVRGATGGHVLCPPRDAQGRRLVSLSEDDMLVVVKTS